MKWRQIIALLEQENRDRASVQAQGQKIIQFNKIQKQQSTTKAVKNQTSKKDKTVFSFL